MASNGKPVESSIKDKLSIILSVSALLVSLSSFYFSYFRIEDNLQARVTGTDIIRSISDTLSDTFICDTAVVQIAFVNGGNRQSIILTPWYQLADTTNTYNGAWGAEFDNSNMFPIILQPHEMKIVDLKLSANALTLNPGKVSKDSPYEFEYFLAKQYFSLDSKGKKHDVWGEFNVHVYAKENKIKSILEVDNLNNYTSTNLFSDNKKSNSTIVSDKTLK